MYYVIPFVLQYWEKHEDYKNSNFNFRKHHFTFFRNHPIKKDEGLKFGQFNIFGDKMNNSNCKKNQVYSKVTVKSLSIQLYVVFFIISFIVAEFVN